MVALEGQSFAVLGLIFDRMGPSGATTAPVETTLLLIQHVSPYLDRPTGLGGRCPRLTSLHAALERLYLQ